MMCATSNWWGFHFPKNCWVLECEIISSEVLYSWTCVVEKQDICRCIIVNQIYGRRQCSGRSHSCFLVTLMIHNVQLFMYTTSLLIHNCTSTTPSWWSIASGILSRASHNHCDEKMGSGKGNGNIHWKCYLRGLAKYLNEEDLNLGS